MRIIVEEWKSVRVGAGILVCLILKHFKDKNNIFVYGLISEAYKARCVCNLYLEKRGIVNQEEKDGLFSDDWGDNWLAL